MRLQIEPTDKIVKVNGTACRMWRGVTKKGAKCFVFVATIGTVDGTEGCRELEQELRELPHPGEEAEGFLHIHFPEVT